MMSRLQQTPDGIMVSLETINDYSLKPGDLLKLRVLDQRTGHFHVVRSTSSARSRSSRPPRATRSWSPT